MKSKKTVLLVLALCLTLTAMIISAHTKDKEPEKKTENPTSKISQKIDAYTTDLKDSADSMQSDGDILKYLAAWADAKKIDHRRDKAGNLIFTKPAAEGCTEVPPTVFICPCDYRMYDQCISPLALSLYLIKNTETAGKLTIVYTPSSGDRYKALSSLNSKILPQEAKILTLNPGGKGVFATASSGGSTYRFDLKGRRTKPRLGAAYEIKISGLTTGLPDAKINEYPNPIKKMEDILTWITNKKDQFELVSFRGGSDTALYPSEAAMVITIDPNEEDKFIEKMDSMTEKWLEKHQVKYPDASFAYTKVDLPRKAYDTETSHRFVSFLYTLLDGEYAKDEEDNTLISICSISKIATGKKHIRIWSSAYSLKPESLEEMDNGELTLANLSGAGFQKIYSLPQWTGQEDTPFTQAVKASYDKTSGKSLHYNRSVAPTCTGFVQENTGSTDIISVTVSENILKESTAALYHYLTTAVSETEDQ